MSTKPRLLIAEDDDLVRRALERALSPVFTVILAKDGNDGADEFFKDQGIRLVMSDGDMPGANGAVFHASIKSELERRKGKFFLITAGSTDEQLLEHFRRHPVPTLHKPFEVAELRGTLLAAWRGLPAL